MITKGTSTKVDNKIEMIWGALGVSDTNFAVVCDCGIQTRWFDSEFHASAIWNRAFPAPAKPLTNSRDIVDAVERAHKNTGDSKIRFKERE